MLPEQLLCQLEVVAPAWEGPSHGDEVVAYAISRDGQCLQADVCWRVAVKTVAECVVTFGNLLGSCSGIAAAAAHPGPAGPEPLLMWLLLQLLLLPHHCSCLEEAPGPDC